MKRKIAGGIAAVFLSVGQQASAEPQWTQVGSYEGIDVSIDISSIFGLKNGDSIVYHKEVIPKCTDQYPCAQWRKPIDMMRQGWSTSLFQAKQQ